MKNLSHIRNNFLGLLYVVSTVGSLALVVSCSSLGLQTRGDVQDQTKEKELRTQVSAVQKSRADQEAHINDLQQDMKVFAGRLEALEFNQGKSGGDIKQELEVVKKQNEALTERLKVLESHVDATEMRIMSALNGASENPPPKGKTPPNRPLPGAAVVPKTSTGAASHGGATVVTGEASGKGDDLYEEGDRYFAAKDWKKAMFSYNKYRDQNPKGKNAAEASYKIGVCFAELGMKKEAKAFYDTTLSEYPNSPAARKARYRISNLK